MPAAITKKEFEKRLKETTNGKFILDSGFIDYKHRCNLKHLKCGNVFDVNPRQFLANKNREDVCPYCGLTKSKPKTIEDYKQEVYDLFNGEYEILEDKYINNKTKMLTKHLVCGTEFEIKPNGLLSAKYPCPHCVYKLRNIRSKKTTEEFKELVKKESKGYEVLGEYIDNKTKILMKHLVCGTEFEIRPNDFQQGYRCPICSKSTNKKVDVLEEFFDSNNIKYRKEVSFKNCYYKEKLKFDYYLEEYNLIIELDGQLHFNSSDTFNENIKDDVTRDWIKNLWCKYHDVKFLRIYSRISNNILLKVIKEFLYNDNYEIINKKHFYYDDNKKVYNMFSYYEYIKDNYFILYDDSVTKAFDFYEENLA